jgi:hypothetical protein
VAARRFTAARRKTFLRVLSESGNVSRATRQAGVSRTTAYAHRETDPVFAQAWDEAIVQALDELEEALLARAREGIEKPVHFQGQQIGSVRTYSDQLAMFLLKARRPEVFGDAETGLRSKAGLRHARQQLDRKLARLAAASSADGVPGLLDGS